MTANSNSTSSQQNIKYTTTESEHTLQSVSTVRNVGNSNIKETSHINTTEEFKTLEINNKAVKRRNSTLAALTSKLIDIKGFKLTRKSNKHQKVVLKAVAKAPKRDIIISRKLFPSFSKTVDSDLGVLPAILTKNSNTLLTPRNPKEEEAQNANYVLKKDTRNDYYPHNDPLVNFSNPVELPITSTPEKPNRKNINDLERMVGDMDVYSMSYSSIPRNLSADKDNVQQTPNKMRTMKIKK